MIAPLNSEERAIVKAEVASLSHSNPIGNPEQNGSDSISALPTDITVIPDDGCIEGPLTYFRYYLADADEFAYRSEQAPRSLQQKLVRTGLVGAGLLATLASGMAAIDAFSPNQPDTKKPPLPPPPLSQIPEPHNAGGTQATPQPTTPETIAGTSSPLQFSLSPSPAIAQLEQSTAQLAQPTAPIPVLPELSGSQLEATQAAFSLPEPQFPTAPTIAALDSNTQQALTPVQNSPVSNQNMGTVSHVLNAPPSGLLQPTEPNPSNLVTNGAIAANPISPPESLTAPLSASNAANPNPVQPLAAEIANAGQSLVPNATQPSVTPIASNFPMPTVQTVTNPDPGNAELALNPNPSTVTMPGDRLLEAVPRQLAPTVSPSATPNNLPVALSELPQDVSPAVRHLLQPNAEVTGIQVAVMPLTQQESQEVATRDRLGQFKILRLSQSAYQQEWRTSNGDTDSPAPTFGFVDYPRQVIAVMQPLTPTSANPVIPSAQVSVSVSAPEPAIAE
ncbi:hypothetical protein ACN4EK_06055 [Pantanalinema rosaneae CENA516]|uniref:hypothetical protein n=1 Tax=Pantanalinema rosaneae TaxID=1620701 RepID=UPI003D6ED380